MAHIPSHVYKAISENDIDAVVFQDPFQDETRKAKRNVVAASFTALLISTLDLQINGFLGLQTATGTMLAASITRGLACIITIYFFVGFTFSAFIDYIAWKFKRERLMIKPYLELISMTEGQFRTLSEQILNATSRLEHLSFSKDMQAKDEVQNAIQESLGQLKSISESSVSRNAEITPLLQQWAQTIEKTSHLTLRLRARFISLWILDILIPLILAIIAIWITSDGLRVIFSNILSTVEPSTSLFFHRFHTVCCG